MKPPMFEDFLKRQKEVMAQRELEEKKIPKVSSIFVIRNKTSGKFVNLSSKTSWLRWQDAKAAWDYHLYKGNNQFASKFTEQTDYEIVDLYGVIEKATLWHVDKQPEWCLRSDF